MGRLVLPTISPPRSPLRALLGGKWVPSESGRTFESLDPATGEVIGVVAKSSPSDVNRAVEAAASAYQRWRLVPAPKRGEILFRVGQLLQQRKEQLAQLMSREMGKVIAETRGDVQQASTLAKREDALVR